MNPALQETAVRRVLPLQNVGIYLIVFANALTWIPLILFERSQLHQEDPFFLCSIIAGVMTAFGITLNVAGLVKSVRQRTSKGTALLGIAAGIITTIAIVIAVGFRVFQLLNW
jgi:hypothetical protein